MNYEKIISDLGIKIANLTIENAVKDAEISDLRAEMDRLRNAQAQANNVPVNNDLVDIQPDAYEISAQ